MLTSGDSGDEPRLGGVGAHRFAKDGAEDIVEVAQPDGRSREWGVARVAVGEIAPTMRHQKGCGAQRSVQLDR